MSALSVLQVILAVIITWVICFVLTITNILPNDRGKWGYEARTDLRQNAIFSSPWFRLPYPGIYGNNVHFYRLICIILIFKIYFWYVFTTQDMITRYMLSLHVCFSGVCQELSVLLKWLNVGSC